MAEYQALGRKHHVTLVPLAAGPGPMAGGRRAVAAVRGMPRGARSEADAVAQALSESPVLRSRVGDASRLRSCRATCRPGRPRPACDALPSSRSPRPARRRWPPRRSSPRACARPISPPPRRSAPRSSRKASTARCCCRSTRSSACSGSSICCCARGRFGHAQLPPPHRSGRPRRRRRRRGRTTRSASPRRGRSPGARKTSAWPCSTKAWTPRIRR